MFFLRFNRINGGSGCQIDSLDVIRKLVPFGTPDKSGAIENGRVLLVQCVNWNTVSNSRSWNYRTYFLAFVKKEQYHQKILLEITRNSLIGQSIFEEVEAESKV